MLCIPLIQVMKVVGVLGEVGAIVQGLVREEDRADTGQQGQAVHQEDVGGRVKRQEVAMMGFHARMKVAVKQSHFIN